MPYAPSSTQSFALPLLTAACLVLLPMVAQAQDYRDDRRPVDGDREEAYYNSREYTDEGGVPYAGKDLGYDYLDDEYYRYAGQPEQDPRAREQDGWRDGVLHTTPRGYYWRSWYDHGCGCTRGSYYRVYNSWGQHEYRQIYRTSRYDYDRGSTYYDRRDSYYSDRRY